jgi:hypothetical protein
MPERENLDLFGLVTAPEQDLWVSITRSWPVRSS